MTRGYKLRSLLALGSAIILSLSTVPYAQAKESITDVVIPHDAELLGDYLAGSYANLLDDTQASARYFKKAFEAAPDDVRLGRRAVTSAVTAGKFDDAYKLAKNVYKIDKTESMAQAVLAIEAFKKGKYKRVKKYLNSDSADVTMGIVMGFTEVWNHAAMRDYDQAVKALEKQKGRNYFEQLALLHEAKINALRKDEDEAIRLFDALQNSNQSMIEAVLSGARYYAASGNSDKALKYIDDYIEKTGFDNGPIKIYREALASGKSIPKPLNPREQLSRALTDPSYEFFLRNRAYDVAEVYLRLALELDPNNEKAKLWMADILDRTRRSDEALVMLSKLSDDSPYVVTARLSEANIYFDRDEDEKALRVLEDVNAKHETFVTREALGRARLIREKYAEALPIYTAIIDSMSEEELKENTQPLYFRGISYERTKQWEKAEADFLRVLELEPENADALNYLGYTWVDRGENLEKAFDMIRKAVALEPGSGAIIDSLGWAHYKLGEYEEAKIQLEKAVTLSPSSATIVDHLGDLYWRLGRYREAGYQWERALIYDPTDEERETIQKKLKHGLTTTPTKSVETP